MSIDFAKTYDVVIIGGGPVGMGLAIELGQRGQSVAVVEKHQTLHNIPIGQNLIQRTLEHFHFWGPTPNCAPRVWFKELCHWRHDVLWVVAVGLSLRLDAAGTCRRNWRNRRCFGLGGRRCNAIRRRSQRVAGNATGRYVVACDGSHSRIRDAAGIAQTVSEHNRKMVLLVFRSTGFIRILNGLRANSSTAC